MNATIVLIYDLYDLRDSTAIELKRPRRVAPTGANSMNETSVDVCGVLQELWDESDTYDAIVFGLSCLLVAFISSMGLGAFLAVYCCKPGQPCNCHGRRSFSRVSAEHRLEHSACVGRGTTDSEAELDE